jgi:hypothetical protein
MAGQQEWNAKSTKATKGEGNVCEDAFVLFVCFVVQLINACKRRPRCVLSDLGGERLCPMQPRGFTACDLDSGSQRANLCA